MDAEMDASLFQHHWNLYRNNQSSVFYQRPYITGDVLEKLRIPTYHYYSLISTPLLLCNYPAFATAETNDNQEPYLNGIDIYLEVNAYNPRLTDPDIHKQFLYFIFTRVFLPKEIPHHKSSSLYIEKMKRVGYYWDTFLSEYLPCIDQPPTSDIERVYLSLREKQYQVTRQDLESILQPFLNHRKNDQLFKRFLYEEIGNGEEYLTKSDILWCVIEQAKDCAIQELRGEVSKSYALRKQVLYK